MRTLYVLAVFIGLVILPAASGCSKSSSSASNCTETRISIPGLGRSHQNGNQCVTCHTFQGVGPGCFTIGGSVYQANKVDPYTAGEIRLHTLPNGQGELKGTYYIDGKGNFYSTAKIEWNQTLYVSMYDANGNAKHMQGVTNDGNCNRCHGAADDRLVLP